jgi:hypothetical protein
MTAGDSGAWASAGKGFIQQQCGKCLISAAIRALVGIFEQRSELLAAFGAFPAALTVDVLVHKVVAWRDVMSLACGF